MTKKNTYNGSSFDDILKEDGCAVAVPNAETLAAFGEGTHPGKLPAFENFRALLTPVRLNPTPSQLHLSMSKESSIRHHSAVFPHMAASFTCRPSIA